MTTRKASSSIQLAITKHAAWPASPCTPTHSTQKFPQYTAFDIQVNNAIAAVGEKSLISATSVVNTNVISGAHSLATKESHSTDVLQLLLALDS